MSAPSFTLRHQPRTGDIGWVIHRHGVVYARELGWDERFEGYVAQTLATFALGHEPARERLWLAETGDRIVGSIGIVDGDVDAQLRWFLVEPDCRGMGIGHRLIDEALAFCRATGRRHVHLWTVAGLDAAAHLYTTAGFRVVERVRGAPWHAEAVQEKYALTL